jgi:hypothetical protein
MFVKVWITGQEVALNRNASKCVNRVTICFTKKSFNNKEEKK